MEKGFNVFAPIAHSHPIESYGMRGVMTGDWWLEQDFAILTHCDALVVHMVDGWDRSHGVKEEMDFAFARGIPVYFLEEDISEWKLT